jgi:drug/metabolite transporter (DMT)-like permease
MISVAEDAGFRRRALEGAALMILCAVLLAVTTLLAKTLGRGVGGTPLHPLQVSAGRFCFAFATILPFALWFRPPIRGSAWALHVGRSFCGWAGVSCMFAAAALMPLADATAISFLSPMITMLLAIPLLGERVGPWRWSAAAVALGGGMVIIRPGTDAFQFAAVIALVAALFQGVEAILIKKLTARENPLRILTINNAIGATIAASAAAFVWTAPSPGQWAMLAILGATMVTAQSLFLFALRRTDASYAIPFFYATLLFAAAYDLALFGEAPDGVSIAGMVLIVAGALVLAWREGIRRR